jgi:transposase-like protein
MDKTISELRERIEQSSKTKTGGRAYRAELRDDIVELTLAWTSHGNARSELARRLGISSETLKCWMQSRTRDAQRNARMRPVRVLDPEPPPTMARTLLLPSGARIEGLTMDELITLARALA